MAKRIAYIAITTIIILLVLCGCNMGVGLGNFKFKICHVCDFAGNSRDYHVMKWYNDSNGIEIVTEDGESIFFSEGTYILYESECDLCG